MRFLTGQRLLAMTAVLTLAACADGDTTVDSSNLPAPVRLNASSAASVPSVRISEIHYDNTGTDIGEFVEVSAPAGTDLSGWSIVLYNGSGGASYDTDALSGIVANQCSGRGTVVINYPSNGIQNGSPDGIALVNGTTVVEFLSYEGSFAATNGPANGMTSTDIGVSENGSEPVGQSLSRTGANVWSSGTASNGSCNPGENDQAEPPAEVASVTVSPAPASVVIGNTTSLSAEARSAANAVIAGTSFTWSSSNDAVATVSSAGVVTGVSEGQATITATAPNNVSGTAIVTVTPAAPLPSVRFSEIHYDNAGSDVAEFIEVEGPAGTDLTGWRIVLYNGNGGGFYNDRILSGIIPQQCGVRGAVAFLYPTDGLQNGAPDGFALVNPEGETVEFLSYEGGMTATNGPATGLVATDIGVAESSATPVGQSLARNASGVWTGPQAMSYNSCNANGPVPPPNTITFTGRTPFDAPLPVGFQDQLFATENAGLGGTITTTFTWSSDTPALASVDQRGVITGIAAGDATLRATAEDGTTATITLPISVAQPSATASYVGNAAFGIPSDGSAADDIILTRTEFTASFNPVRNIPNWVSYNLEASHITPGQDRCDCFTYDPLLPGNLPRYTTADYTGGGAALGLVNNTLDRGHLARSFDRTSGALDNARTFYFSNIIPQIGSVNQGPWALFENYLGGLAQSGTKELYIITGATGSQGTVKNEGRITIPEYVWKVAVIMDRDRGPADVDGLEDLEVVAVVMPNSPSVPRGAAWEEFRVTVDSVEALSGYDILAMLRDDLEIAIESETAFPEAAVDGPYAQLENLAIAMSGAASSDADDDALTYAWSFGDGATASGVTVSHAYAAAGQYTVRLIVTDVRGLADTVTTTATILTPAQGLGAATASVQELVAAGRVNRGEANALQVSIDAAIASLGRGNETAATNQLEALRSKLDAMVRSGRLTPTEAAGLFAVIEQVLASIAG